MRKFGSIEIQNGVYSVDLHVINISHYFTSNKLFLLFLSLFNQSMMIFHIFLDKEKNHNHLNMKNNITVLCLNRFYKNAHKILVKKIIKIQVEDSENVDKLKDEILISD